MMWSSNPIDNSCVDKYDLISPALHASISWIESVLKVNVPTPNGFRKALASGEILCSLMNAICPGAIKRINRCPNRASASDNLTLFISACQTNCGIPKARLFDISDFEDIFDGNFPSNTCRDSAVRKCEEVAISIFWLAKFVEQSPRLTNFPKLDYAAFSTLIPGKITLANHSDSPRDQFIERVSHNRANFASVANSSSTRSPEPALQAVVTEQNTMGNTLSAQPTVFQNGTSNLGDCTNENGTCNPVTVKDSAASVPSDSVVDDSTNANMQTPMLQAEQLKMHQAFNQQQNNNSNEEDDWQANLFAWRERQRRISRLEAPAYTSFEETRLEEERRKQEAARDRLRQIIAQHKMDPNPYVSSPTFKQPLTPCSPGLAILMGRANPSFDYGNTPLSDQDTSVPQPLRNDVVVSETAEQQEPATPDAKSPKCTNASEPMPAHGSQINGDIHGSSSASERNSPLLEQENSRDKPTETNQTLDTVDADQYQEVEIRIQTKLNANEIRWGMTLSSNGPSATAPFVVKHVKMGSTADVCDLSKGDVLVRVNQTDVRQTSSNLNSKPFTLTDLEAMLDHLGKTGQPVRMRVLRKHCNIDEELDDMVEDESYSYPAEPPPRNSSQKVSSMLAKQDESSDIDEQASLDTALIVGRGQRPAANSIANFLPPKINSTTNGTQNSISPKPVIHNSISCVKMETTDYGTVTTETADGIHHQSLRNPKLSTDLVVRSSLTSKIIETNEVGTAHLRTPSQADDTMNSRTANSSQSAHRAELANTEPTYVSMVGTCLQKKPESTDIHVRKPYLGDPSLVHITRDNSTSPAAPSPIRSVMDISGTESPHHTTSPLPPPPPPFPLLPDDSELLALDRKPLNSFQHGGVARNSEPRACSNVPRYSSRHSPFLDSQTSDLPSPPPLPLCDTLTDTMCSRRVDSFASFSTDHGFNRGMENGDYCYNSRPKMPIPFEITSPIIPSSKSNYMSPLSHQHKPASVLRPHGPAINETKGAFTPLPPPPRVESAFEPPPPNTRKPQNKGINPKSKCTACNQELGTGDLMIISSMSLYYHLACFVCSWCGIPLSDGLSNADVRIRSNQLYCHSCYPSRHGHRSNRRRQEHKRQPDNEQRQQSSSQMNPALACADKRLRPRGRVNDSRDIAPHGLTPKEAL